MSGTDNGLATLEELFNRAPKRRYDVVTLPVSGHKMRVRSLTEREVSGWQAEMFTGQSNRFAKSRLVDANLRLFKLCVVDNDGNQMLSDSHVRKMADWDSADTGHLYDCCARHCGINKEDVEGLAKNAESGCVATTDAGPPSAPSAAKG